MEHLIFGRDWRVVRRKAGMNATRAILGDADVPADADVDNGVGGGRQAGKRTRDDRRRRARGRAAVNHGLLIALEDVANREPMISKTAARLLCSFGTQAAFVTGGRVT